ncbi:ribosome hibernation-promoting factor, HPF/YfiA family [Phytomonospora endophytica]|uniref:Ribosome hibernation promoting factor n=1 Tax=Phytomonospora endophytica TaxID=714109 RepID=A0A841FTJ5_9ACTN|nr:ribosome-associated translation inhibitor RaiA [Phytomonospora endophytica]MBB6039645.1 ribosomal subunit interface protein [Phytomonospora endophytica]GIG65636.1 ribosomal subunit interface protein [Phytomonospora endophytica]
MEIVVKGRNVEVPEHYRQLVEEKLAKVEKFDHKLIRIEVELLHEPNRRQSERCQRVELTCLSRGPVIRAEACAKDFYAALDAAVEKLNNRLRKSADRRRVHRGRRTPVSVAAATADLPVPVGVSANGTGADGAHANGANRPTASLPAADLEASDPYADLVDEDLPGRIVREKDHAAEAMTVDDALFHMELVGHDFYLFHDKESGKPSVVYRRKGYAYGLIRLDT